MDFLLWHYTNGIRFYVNSWFSFFTGVIHYFSLPLLFKTFFSPWKRLVETDNSPGFNVQKYFETLTFNLVSRSIGAIVRFFLIIAGLFVIIGAFLSGGAGLILWIILPFLGYPVYEKVQNRPEDLLQKLLAKNASKGSINVIRFFKEKPGIFVIKHLGISSEEFVQSLTNIEVSLSEVQGIKTFRELVTLFVQKNVLDEGALKKKGVDSKDVEQSALWWDIMQTRKTSIGTSQLTHAGIGRELLFGYTPTLNKYTTDLSAPQSYTHHLIGRENVVSRIERTLSGGSSAIVLAQPGVGKKTVVLEFAHRAYSGKLGSEMSYRRVLEFDYNSFLSGLNDVNEKKSELSAILKEAASAGNVILVVRDIHRLTNSEVEGYDFTDIFESALEKKTLKIIALTTPYEYERFIVPNMRLRKHFETIEVTPPSYEDAFEILLEFAHAWEDSTKQNVSIPALRKILEESDKYVTDTPFPEKALELFDAVTMYVSQKGSALITTDDVSKVLSEKTGVSFEHLSGEEKNRLSNLEEIIHERLVNQSTAVNLIAKTLRAKTLGIADGQKPVGSFLFLGPTGVGKTETAKVLSNVYFGSQEKIIRFDMAEFGGKEGFERLIGSQEKNLPGVLTTAIKNNPASLLLLDEFEKTTKDVLNLFLRLLDEGVMTDAFGKQVLGRHLFVICTSNAGANYIRNLVSKGISGEELQKQVVDHVLNENIFSPELLNRFDGVVVYEPLSSENLEKIARILLANLQKRLEKKFLKFVITDELVRNLAEVGNDPAFGARPMNRIIDLMLGDVIGRALLDGTLEEDSRFSLYPKEDGEYEIRILSKDTA